MEDESPLAVNPRVALACTTLPMEGPARSAVLPERVDIDHGESAVALCRRDNPNRCPQVVDELVVREELDPCSLPAITVVPALRKDPADRIVVTWMLGPGPDHVGMEDLDERFGILRVPGASLAIHHLLDLFLNGYHVGLGRLPGWSYPVSVESLRLGFSRGRRLHELAGGWGRVCGSAASPTDADLSSAEGGDRRLQALVGRHLAVGVDCEAFAWVGGA